MFWFQIEETKVDKTDSGSEGLGVCQKFLTASICVMLHLAPTNALVVTLDVFILRNLTH